MSRGSRSQGSAGLIGGFHAVAAALERGRVRGLRVAAGRSDRRLQELLADAERRGVAVASVPRRALDQLDLGRHQGVVAELVDGGGPSSGRGRGGARAQGAVEATHAFAEEGLLEDLLDAARDAGRAPLLLVLEGVTDPRNLGAALRSADGAGVDAVVVPRSRTAPLNAAAVGVASGAAESVPVVAVANLARSLDWLRQRGLSLYGLAGEGDRAPWEVDLSEPVALVLGAEDKGLRRLTREACDGLLALPMAGAVSSLNVSVAAGVVLFEAARQRSV